MRPLEVTNLIRKHQRSGEDKGYIQKFLSLYSKTSFRSSILRQYQYVQFWSLGRVISQQIQ